MQNNEKKSAPIWPLLLGAMLLIFGGAGVFLYPTFANYYAERHQATVIQEYIEKTEEISTVDLSREWDLAIAYNANLSGEAIHDPFVSGSGYVVPDNYLEVLNMNGDGVMGFISIPKINVNMPIYHGSGEDSLQRGAGHIEQTYMPIGGTSRHAVLTGHRGLPNAEMFTRLDELKLGDIFTIKVLDTTLAYEVDKITVVEPHDLKEIATVPGEDLVTLVTCTPYAVNTHRLLVRGHRTEYIPEEMESSGSTLRVVVHGLDQGKQILGIKIGLAVVAVAVVLILFVGKKDSGGKGGGKFVQKKD